MNFALILHLKLLMHGNFRRRIWRITGLFKANYDLSLVPATHQALLNSRVRSWFQNFDSTLQSIINANYSQHMTSWFQQIQTLGSWQLNLHLSSNGYQQASFKLSAPDIRGAEIGVPPDSDELLKFPTELQAFHALVDHVHWNGFGAGGGLYPIQQHYCLLKHNLPGKYTDDFQVENLFALGDSPCGDVLFYSTDGRAGWFAHGDGTLFLLGSIRETIDWVFEQLLLNECPEIDYNW